MATIEQFIVQCAEMPAALAKAQADGINAAALHVKQSVQHEGPSRMRNFGSKGAALGVGFPTAKPGVDVSTTVAARGNPGAWAVAETGAKPHVMPKMLGARAIRNRVRRGQQRIVTMAFADGVFSRVHHPGMKGFHKFELGVVRAIPGLDNVVAKSYFAAVARNFKG